MNELSHGRFTYRTEVLRLEPFFDTRIMVGMVTPELQNPVLVLKITHAN